MAKRRLSMRKIEEILRLRLENNCSVRQIAKSCDMGRSTVADYLSRIRKVGLTWPLPPDLDDSCLEEMLFPTIPDNTPAKQQMPPMDYLFQELKKKGVTLQYINRTYLDLAQHYGITVIPARPSKPRDKAKVESAVLIAERWIIAPLRNHSFFSIAELNKAIAQKLVEFNGRKLQKLDATRNQLFERIDKPALKPLPETAYEFAEWKKARVNIDYHIEIYHHYYSVPYQLRKEQADVRITSRTIEVLFKNQRVASHLRSYQPHGFTTLAEHMPKSHQKYLEWTPSRIIRWAAKNGPCTEKLISLVLETKLHPEQAYRSCLGIMRLSNRFSPERLEAACARAIRVKAYSYKSIESILKKGLDQQLSLFDQTENPKTVNHPNIRGEQYYN